MLTDPRVVASYLGDDVAAVSRSGAVDRRIEGEPLVRAMNDGSGREQPVGAVGAVRPGGGAARGDPGVLVVDGPEEVDERRARRRQRPSVPSVELPEGVLPFSVAEANGEVDDIDWGERCDVDEGVLAAAGPSGRGVLRSVHRADNGGDTAVGVTDDTIKVVVYVPQENDPILSSSTARSAPTTRREDTSQTYQGYNEMLATYYETYGRRVELVRYNATGTDQRCDRGNGRRRDDRPRPAAVRRHRRSAAHRGVRRHARGEQGHVRLVHARPDDRVVRAAGPLRVGPAEERRAEHAHGGGVHRQAPRRRQRGVRRRRRGRRAAQVRL